MCLMKEMLVWWGLTLMQWLQCRADLWAAVSPYFQHMTDGVIIETVLVCSTTSGHQVLRWGVYSWRQPGRGWHDINSCSQGFHDSKLRLFFSLLLTGAGCWLALVSAQLQFYLRRRRNLSGVIFVFSQTWGSSIKWCAGGFSYLLVQDIYCYLI